MRLSCGRIVDKPQFIHSPQFSTGLSTGLSTGSAPVIHRFIHNLSPGPLTFSAPPVHNLSKLSTEVVDNSASLWMNSARFIHIWTPACGQAVDKIRVKCFSGGTKSLPWREGSRDRARVNACF